MAADAGAGEDGVVDADVILPDGTLAWCDGGPLHLWGDSDEQLFGALVVPRVALTRGNLTPVVAHPPTAMLAPDQILAVADPSTRARIIAPAGSGKTRVLTERARHLLHSFVPAASLTSWPSTSEPSSRSRADPRPPRAAGPDPQRARARHPERARGFAARGPRVQRRRARRSRTARPAGEVPAAREHGPRRVVDRRALANPPRPAEPASVEEDFGGDVEGFADVFPRYRSELARRGAVDFDEQIYRCLEVLLTEPEVRRRRSAGADACWSMSSRT